MRTRMQIAALVLSIAFGAAGTLEAAPSSGPEFLFIKNMAPRSRVGLGFSNHELSRHEFFERRQSLYAFGEYAFTDFFSLHASVPYTRRWITDSERRSHLDNIELGAKLGWDLGGWMPYFGLAGNLATGNEESGIGSKEFGNVEPYAGLRLGQDWFFFAVGARYNSQTNRQFREDDEQEFRRYWLLESALAFSFSWIDLMLEYQYKHLRDPGEAAFSGQVLAPGVNLKIGDLVVGLSVPWALSKEREYDLGFRLQATYLF
ncbi:MAG: hypothetical protein H7A21_16465 [Spirochaetales bacterium]|nr:hypothetical protein [Leptospiraceae bacterium]MCP5483031.1 hypothetical protein [Spirochaetales bacterium]MCP5486163.1 hypothetical protein [Spirochaetales bacterium]